MMNQLSPAQPSTDRICILVLGMHRSGTSALTRVLSLFGCDLPATLLGASETNEAGHWESVPVMELNDAILESAGSDWRDWLTFHPGWYSSPKSAEFKERAVAILEEEFGASRLFTLKDPRICRIVPFWLDVLATAGVRPAVILPIRNPLEVAASLARRNGFDPEFGHLLWLRHVLEAEAATRGLPRFTCSYDSLLEGWGRLAGDTQTALSVAWPRLSPRVSEEVDAFLTERLRHHRESPKSVVDNPLLSSWLRDSFGIFLRWSEHNEADADHAVLDRIRAEFDAAAPAFARLISAGWKARDGLNRAEAECREIAEAKAAGDLALEQVHATLSATQAGLNEQAKAADELRAELHDVRGRLSYTESALAQRSAEAEEVTALLRAAETQVAATEEARREAGARANRIAEDAKAECDLAKAERDHAKAERDRVQVELLKLRTDKAEVETRLSERFGEIAAITRMLSERDGALRLSEDHLEWLRQVSSVLMQEGRSIKARLRAFMPASSRRAKLYAELKRKGIFDAGAYLAAHPDVEAEAMDPLWHYMNHGMTEGRGRF